MDVNNKTLPNDGHNSFAQQILSEKETESDILRAVKNETQALNISHRHLTVLPSCIAKMTCIKRLLLNNNDILMPPTEIVNLHTLEELTLDHNQLTVLPSGLGGLSNLRYLSLSHNKLSYLPPDIGDLKKLAQLWLVGCELAAMPSEIGLLSSLQMLGARDNLISELPNEISQCLKLKWLNLAGNWLQDLPSHFERLQNLIYLDISENRVVEIPPCLTKLHRLSTLLLRKNFISSLPDDLLLGFSSLIKFDLRENKMTVRPSHWKVNIDFHSVLVSVCYLLRFGSDCLVCKGLHLYSCTAFTSSLIWVCMRVKIDPVLCM